MTQQNRPIRVRIGSNDGSANRAYARGLGSDLVASLANELATPLFVHKFHANERVCAEEPLRLNLLCVATRKDLSPQYFLGQPIQVQLVTDVGNLRTFDAIVNRAQPGQDDGGLQTWLIGAVDAMTYMGAGRNSRNFLRKSVLEISVIIQQEWQRKSSVLGGCFKFSTRGLDSSLYPVREMTLQWNESDSAFLQRLWRKHAIGWGIQSGDANASSSEASMASSLVMAHSLVLFDDAGRLPQNPAGQLRFHIDTTAQERDAITLWSPAAHLRPGRVEGQSWDYKAQQTTDQASPTILDFGPQGNDMAAALLDSQAHAPHWADDKDEYSRLGDARMKYHEMQASLVQGASGSRDAAALTWVTVQDRPGVALCTTLAGLAGASDDYLFLDVEHWGQSNLPKNLSEWADNLFVANGWRMDPPVIGSHDESRRYANTFTAIARFTPVVPSFDPVRDWPCIPPMSVVVVCPEGEEVYCDQTGRVRVRFPGLRVEDNAHAQGAGTSGLPMDSAWIRVAMPAASAGHGMLQLPRKDDEMIASFLGGDPDKPVLTHALYSPRSVPASFHGVNDLPGNRYLSGNRAREVFGRQATHIQHDSTPGQTSLQLHADQACTQLNMGFMTTPRRGGEGTPRGEGAEIRTKQAAAVHATQGILLSAWERLQDNQLTYTEALSLMNAGLSIFKTMGEYAAQHQGLALGLDPQQQLHDIARDWEAGTNTRPDAPPKETGIVAVTAPEGIAHTTKESVVSVAGKNVDTVALQDVQQVAGQRFVMQAGTGMSLFAHDGGMQAIAHRGPMLLQSQNDATVMESGKTLDMRSLDDLRLSGKTVTITAQDGSFIKIGAGITFGTKDAIQHHAASFSYDGPQTRNADIPSAHFSGQTFSLRFAGAGSNQVLADAHAGRPYKVLSDTGKVLLSGVVPENGELPRLATDKPETLRLSLSDESPKVNVLDPASPQEEDSTLADAHDGDDEPASSSDMAPYADESEPPEAEDEAVAFEASHYNLDRQPDQHQEGRFFDFDFLEDVA